MPLLSKGIDFKGNIDYLKSNSRYRIEIYEDPKLKTLIGKTLKPTRTGI